MWAQLLTIAATAALVQGHGRVLDPPGRGGLWRVGYSTAPDYDDDGLNCGGFHNHHSRNGGKCGLCGDAYDAPAPRAHERGGRFDSGIITATYEAGSVITITVQITAHHMGYWEFKLCPDPDGDQDCFDANLLELAEGGTKYYPPRSGSFPVEYRLPDDLGCDHCVLQWRYIAGNNWGVCQNGSQGLGCGPQETFGACSDIAITGGSPQFIVPESLLETRINDLGLIHAMFNSHAAAHYWTQVYKDVTTKKPFNKRRKHKGKKKVKPYKSKWNSFWR